MKIKGILIPDVEHMFNSFLREAEKDLEKGIFEKLTEEEKGKVIKVFDEKIISFFEKKIVKNYTLYFKAHIVNQRVISKEHRKMFKYFFGYIKLGHDLYHNLRRNSEHPSVKKSDKIIILLYGYLIRQADEIGVMLLNGYTDGALRLWRAMYEYTAVHLLMMQEHNNYELFKRFIDHNLRNKKRKIDSLMNSYEELKFPPVPEHELKKVQESVKEFDAKYGKDFLQNDYGWATIIFPGKRRITFRDIEEKAEMTRLRTYYIWASAYSHANFDSFFDFLNDEQQLILHQVTQQKIDKTSFVDPIQLTLTLLHESNAKFLELYLVHHEYDINLKLFRRMFEKAIEDF